MNFYFSQHVSSNFKLSIFKTEIFLLPSTHTALCLTVKSIPKSFQRVSTMWDSFCHFNVLGQFVIKYSKSASAVTQNPASSPYFHCLRSGPRHLLGDLLQRPPACTLLSPHFTTDSSCPHHQKHCLSTVNLITAFPSSDPTMTSDCPQSDCGLMLSQHLWRLLHHFLTPITESAIPWVHNRFGHVFVSFCGVSHPEKPISFSISKLRLFFLRDRNGHFLWGNHLPSYTGATSSVPICAVLIFCSYSVTAPSLQCCSFCFCVYLYWFSSPLWAEPRLLSVAF